MVINYVQYMKTFEKINKSLKKLNDYDNMNIKIYIFI